MAGRSPQEQKGLEEERPGQFGFLNMFHASLTGRHRRVGMPGVRGWEDRELCGMGTCSSTLPGLCTPPHLSPWQASFSGSLKLSEEGGEERKNIWVQWKSNMLWHLGLQCSFPLPSLPATKAKHILPASHCWLLTSSPSFPAPALSSPQCLLSSDVFYSGSLTACLPHTLHFNLLLPLVW